MASPDVSSMGPCPPPSAIHPAQTAEDDTADTTQGQSMLPGQPSSSGPDGTGGGGRGQTGTGVMAACVCMGLGAAFVTDLAWVAREGIEGPVGMTQKGVAWTVFLSCVFPRVLVTLASGIIIDRVHAVKLAVSAASLVAIGAIFVALAPTLGSAPLFSTGQFLAGSFSGAVLVAQKTFISKTTDIHELGFYLAVSLSISYIGSLLSWLVVLFLADGRMAYQGALCLGATLCVVSAAFTIYAAKAMPAQRPIPQRTPVTAGQRQELWLSSYLSDLRSVTYAVTVVTTVAFYVSFNVFIVDAVPFLNNLEGLSYRAAVAMVCVFFIATALLTPLFGSRVDSELKPSYAAEAGAIHWWPSGSVQFWGIMFTLAAYGLLSAQPSLSIVAMLLLMLGLSMVPAAVWPTMASFSSSDVLGLGFAIAQAASDLASELLRVGVRRIAFHTATLPLLLGVTGVGVLATITLMYVFAARPEEKFAPKVELGVLPSSRSYVDLETGNEEQKALS